MGRKKRKKKIQDPVQQPAAPAEFSIDDILEETEPDPAAKHSPIDEEAVIEEIVGGPAREEVPAEAPEKSVEESREKEENEKPAKEEKKE